MPLLAGRWVKLTDMIMITGASNGGAVRPPPRPQSSTAARAQVLAPPAHHLAYAHARLISTGQATQGQTQARFYLDRRLQGFQHLHHQHDPLRPQILMQFLTHQFYMLRRLVVSFYNDVTIQKYFYILVYLDIFILCGYIVVSTNILKQSSQLL